MSEFRFAHPYVLALLAVMLAALAYRYYRQRQGQTAQSPAILYSDLRLMQGVPTGWRVRLRRLPDGLRLIAWGLLVIALARPQTGDAREVLRGQGIDIVLVLDISGSMATLDFPPGTRLDAAKKVIGAFISARDFDRIGLVVFARNAFQQSPLTLDYGVLGQLLERVRIVNEIVDSAGNPLLLDGTAIGLGLASAAVMLRESEAPSKVIVLLTDGNNNVALDPMVSAEILAALGVRVYTIGMGTDQAPVTGYADSTLFVDGVGEGSLNEQALRDIADLTDGLYFRAEDSDGLQQIYDQINRLERSRVERQVFIPWQDVGWGLMWAALALLLIERVLRRTLFQTVP